MDGDDVLDATEIKDDSSGKFYGMNTLCVYIVVFVFCFLKSLCYELWPSSSR